MLKKYGRYGEETSPLPLSLFYRQVIHHTWLVSIVPRCVISQIGGWDGVYLKVESDNTMGFWTDIALK